MYCRKQFGRPLSANQLIQKKLADMVTEVTLNHTSLLIYSTCIDITGTASMFTSWKIKG